MHISAMGTFYAMFTEGRSQIIIKRDPSSMMDIDLMKSTGRLCRYKLRLVEFRFEIMHWPRVYYEAADAETRLPQMAS